MSSEGPTTRQVVKGTAIGGALLLALGVLANATGLITFFTDKTMPDFFARSSPTPTAQSGERIMLSGDSPVQVARLGASDGVEVSWPAMDYPGLHEYSVDVNGLAPVETWYNVGYRFGDELKTTVTTYPISETNEGFADQNSVDRVAADETWRICVTGMRETPGGVSVADYVIEGSKICSDPFTLE